MHDEVLTFRCQVNVKSHNMELLKKRLTRSLSGPKRCGDCQKVFFSLNKCKDCGNLIHKHCSDHVDSCHHSLLSEHTTHAEGRRCSKKHNQKEHVSKTNSCESDDVRHLGTSQSYDNNNNVAIAGFLRIIRWLSHRRKAKELRTKASGNEKHVKGRFSLNPKLDNKDARKKLKALLKSTQNYQWHMYEDLYNKPQAFALQRPRCFSSKSSCSTTNVERQRHRSYGVSGDSKSLLSPRSSISSLGQFSSPFSSPKLQQIDRQRVPSEFIDVSKSNWSRIDARNFEPLDSFVRGGRFYDVPNWGSPVNANGDEGLEPSDCNLDPTFFGRKHVKITKAQTLSVESTGISNESLCATWPPVGKAGTIMEEACVDSEISEDEESNYNVQCCPNEERFNEWSIPFSDIEFKEKLRHGRHGDIYRGRWYGEVLIYTFQQNNDAQRRQFLEEVAQMGMIRHENIVLFMGACIEPQRLAVITSMRKGPTLFDYLHLRRNNKLQFHSKLNIAKQIAQGMGYLHAKGITHKNLKSQNIILESRVKLCMLDHGMADKHRDRIDHGCIPRGHLSYWSPEVMVNIRIDPPQIFSTSSCSQQSDIYAFGSLLFELMEEKFLYQGYHPHWIIWQVATGKQCSLDSSEFVNGLKVLIRKCWSHNPNNRPPFSEIVNELQSNAIHQKRHSSSVPDKLHQMGKNIRHLCP